MITKTAFFALMLASSLLLPGQEKKVTIGNCQWLAEQNDFKEVVATAQAGKKPILVVFSATWCGPCQGMKKKVFAAEEFPKISQGLLLLYIEGTQDKGKKYMKDFSVEAIPDIRLLSMNGEFIDKYQQEPVPQKFSAWLHEAVSGENLAGLEERIKNNPGDREGIIKLASRLRQSWDRARVIPLLKQAIALRPDYRDPVSQHAYEMLADEIIENTQAASFGNENVFVADEINERMSKYVRDNEQTILDVIKAYKPDKFKYELRDGRWLARLTKWYGEIGRNDRAIANFEEWLKVGKEEVDLARDLPTVHLGMQAYLELMQADKARYWFDRAAAYYSYSGQEKAPLEADPIMNELGSMISDIVNFELQNGNKSGAEKYLIACFDNKNLPAYVKMNMMYVVEFDDIAVDSAIKFLKELIPSAQGPEKLDAEAALARLISKKDLPQARKMLLDLYRDKVLSPEADKRNAPIFLNTIASSLQQLKIYDEITIEVAQKLVELDPGFYHLENLADSYGGMRRYSEARQTAQAALNFLAEKKDPIISDRMIPDLQKRLEKKMANWQLEMDKAGSAERITIQVGAIQRTYLIHVPAGREAGKPGPLVLAFHGYTDDAEFHEQQTHFNRVADQYGFTVVYGEGIDKAWHLPGFKVKPGQTPVTPEDDVAYVRAIIDRLVADKVADPAAVYSTGYSNGGYFSLYLAQVLNDRIAAIAPVSGGISYRLRDDYVLPRPVPVLMIQGTEDKLVPYAGRPGDLMPAEECAAFLAGKNGAAAEATRTGIPDADSADGTTSVLIEYAGPAPVQLIRIEGGGHEWPNFLPHPQDREWLGHMSRDFDASELIWKFFARFRCPE